MEVIDFINVTFVTLLKRVIIQGITELTTNHLQIGGTMGGTA